MKKIFIFFLLLSSCLNSEDKILYFLQNNWLNVTKFDFLDERVHSENEISRPPNVWIKLISVGKTHLCFKTPFRNQRGTIKLVNGSNCFAEEIRSLNQVENLKVKLENEFLTISFYRFKKEKKWKVVLPNIKGEYPQKIGAFNIASAKEYEGVYFIENAIKGRERRKNSDNNYDYCYQVDEHCEVKLENECHLCQSGWFEIVDNNFCPKGGSRICENGRCGERNQVACLRSKRDVKRGDCNTNKHIGFCQKGLQKECINGILFCL